MRRFVLASTSAVSLFLFLAMLVLVVRGYFYLDDFTFRRSAIHGRSIISQELDFNNGGGYGRAVIQHTRAWANDMSRTEFDRLTNGDLERRPFDHDKLRLNPALRDQYQEARARNISLFGLRVEIDRAPNRAITTIFFSYWPLIALTLMPWSLFLFSVWRRRRARSLGKCPECGYDLCATPDRCPECGTVPGGQVKIPDGPAHVPASHER